MLCHPMTQKSAFDSRQLNNSVSTSASASTAQTQQVRVEVLRHAVHMGSRKEQEAFMFLLPKSNKMHSTHEYNPSQLPLPKRLDDGRSGGLEYLAKHTPQC